jgi:predicted DNA-binding protein with PD1-like motif
MKYSQAGQGRTFVLRLEDGEVVHEQIEQFALEHNIRAAALIVLGGADHGSRLVVGPEQGRADMVVTLEHRLEEVHEVAGTGSIFPDESGRPLLHMHMACGRQDHAVAGCIRNGVKVWQVMEVVLFELIDTSAKRVTDPALGFKLLQP